MMGADLIIVVFAVVVIGGMGSIRGPVVAGYALGLIEGLTKTYFAEAANTVVFVFMVIVLLLRPAGLFGRARRHGPMARGPAARCPDRRRTRRSAHLLSGVRDADQIGRAHV